MAESEHETVAFLGTGIMGTPMAAHLIESGHRLAVWNRTRAKAEPLAEAGAKICESPAEAAQGASVLITMLKDGASVGEAVSAEVLSALQPGAAWIQATTVGRAWAGRLAEGAGRAGVGFVDAPVVGTRQPAEAGQLVVLASAPQELRTRAEEVMSPYAKAVKWVGSGTEASGLKLVVNAWVLAVTAAVGESVALAEGLGLDPALFFEAISGGPLDLAYARIKGGAMIARSFEPNFSVANAAKDASLVLEAASDAGVRARVAAAVAEAMAAAERAGHGEQDMAAIYWAAAAEGSGG